MKKGYYDYIPLIKKETKKDEENLKQRICPFTGLIHPLGTKFVTKDIFKLMFGWEYPSINSKQYYVKPLIYPKTQGSNGKTSRFR